MTGATMFSGILAPEVALPEFEWRWCAEIDRFCCDVIGYRRPSLPNLGDVTDATFIDRACSYGPIDLLVAGSPCQDFSVAGQRAGMDGARGNLALRFLAIVDALRPAWLLFENVPGLLSSASHTAPHTRQAEWYEADEGSDFGHWLSAVRELGYFGAAASLDAQFFGLAQRRERLFFVGSIGDWRPAAAVLFDLESLCGNPAPGRTAGKDIAAASGHGTEVGCADVAPPLNTSWGARSPGSQAQEFDSERGGRFVAFGGNNTAGPIDVATACNAKGGAGRMDFESETFVAFKASHYTRGKDGAPKGITPPLSADADKGDQDILVAFSCKDHGADAGELAPTLRAMGHNGSHANAGGQVAVAFHENQRGEISLNDTMGSLKVGGGKPGQGYPAVAFTERGRKEGRNFESQEELAYALCNPGSGGRTDSRQVSQGMAVRRLTPRECEKLQGFPEDWTLIPTVRKKQRETGRDAQVLLDYYHRTENGSAAVEMRDGRVYATPDGPRYKAIGNSMPVPVIRWIGLRIAEVSAQRWDDFVPTVSQPIFLTKGKVALVDAAKRGEKVDHRDGDGLNCRRSNLRKATSVENGQNRKISKGKTYKGVVLDRGVWRARITVNKKRISLGYFESEEAAARAYDAAAIRLHGEFARLNFPESRRCA